MSCTDQTLRWVGAAVRRNEETRGPAADRTQSQAKGQKSSLVRENQAHSAAGRQESEKNCRRTEGEVQRCSTSGWQLFHLGNQTTHPLLFHSPSSLAASFLPGCMSVCCPLHPRCLSTLPPSIPSPGFLYTHTHTPTVCTHTHMHTLRLSH